MSGNKFTFKNKRPTTSVGLVQTEGFADIKYKGKKVGFISPKSRYKPFCTAYLQVKQEPTFEHPSDWNNKLLSHQTETVQEMKDWLNGNIDTILSENELKYD